MVEWKPTVMALAILFLMVPFVGAEPSAKEGCEEVNGSVMIATWGGRPVSPGGSRVDDRITNYHITNVNQRHYQIFWDTSGLDLAKFGISFWRDTGGTFATETGDPHLPGSGDTHTIPVNTNKIIVWARQGPEAPTDGRGAVTSDFTLLLGC